MTIYVDVDGTLTTSARSGGVFKSASLREDVIEKVKEWIAAGHDVVLWSDDRRYADKVARRLGLAVGAAVKKPDLIVDDKTFRIKQLTRRCLVTPDQFLEMEVEQK